MSVANNTTPGTVVLGGDLTGSATAPALAPTGVIAGSHFVNKMWIDSKGRALKTSDIVSNTIIPLTDTASNVNVGIVKTVPTAQGAWKGLINNTSGHIDAPIATGSVFGQVKADGTSVTIDAGVLNLNLPIASDTVSGLLKVTTGNGLNLVDGVLSMSLQSIPYATNSTAGIVKPGTDFYVAAGTLNYTPSDATTTTKGVLKVTTDTGFNISSGTLSFVPIYPTATTTTKGLIQVTNSNGLDLTAGVLSFTEQAVNVGTSTSVGKVSVPTANGLSVDGSGAVSLATVTASTVGVIKVASGSPLVVNSGVLSFDTAQYLATNTTPGFMQVGSGLSVSSGVVSIPTGTLSVLGKVQVPSANGLSVDGSGNVSVTLANGIGTSGTIKQGSTSTITVVNGDIDVGATIVKKGTANTYTKAQCSALYTNASATSFMQFDPANGDSQRWTLTGNVSFTGFASGVAGGIYSLILKQDATGSRTITWLDTNVKWPNGESPTLTTTPGAYDQITFIYITSTKILAIFSPDWT